MSSTIKKLQKQSLDLKKRMLTMCVLAGKGHVTSSFSCMDVLVALYFGGLMKYRPEDPGWQKRDRFILSKGQASPALYTVLSAAGFFPESRLATFAQSDGDFAVHLQKTVLGVEITAGSLGQGFGVGAGIALGAKMNRELFLTYCLLGDGECYEGSIWETAAFASHNQLNNLVVLIDRNFQCVTDFTENIVALEPLEEKWSSFGFEVKRIDGHNFSAILDTISPLRNRVSNKPTCVILDTVKGQGVASLCYDPSWHGCSPGTDKLDCCLTELLEENQHD